MNPYYQNTAYSPYPQPYIQQPPIHYYPHPQAPPTNYGYGPSLPFHNAQMTQFSHHPLPSGMGSIPKMITNRGQLKDK